MSTVAELTAESIPALTPTAKPKRSRKPRVKPVQAGAARLTSPEPTGAAPWATFGVGLTLTLSAALNGYANSLHAPVAWAGWALGMVIPTIVLVLTRVAGRKHRAGQLRPAFLAGASGVALLFLSVWHCSESIALLTGSGLILAVPMAVAIDCGLVACEVALISEPRD
jgi:hypothetical protein